MEPATLQQQFFNYLKNRIPANISLVDSLCDLLDLGADSVYRRIRGEKLITLNELKVICEHYRLSLDQLLNLQNESVLFNAPAIMHKDKEFTEYMKRGLAQFHYFNSFNNNQIQYLCKDSPIWYFFLFPELASFKTFFWSKTINNQPDLKNKIYSFSEFPFTECFIMGQKMLQEYNKIPSVEMWNLESFNSTINQIAYYKAAGNFKSKGDYQMVIDSLYKTLDHLDLQAERGVKFMPGSTDLAYKASYQFYVNELVLGNNTMVVYLDGNPISMITYSVFHYLFTSDGRFSEKVIESFESLLNRSTHISKTGEKDRNRFFNSLREKVGALEKEYA